MRGLVSRLVITFGFVKLCFRQRDDGLADRIIFGCVKLARFREKRMRPVSFIEQNQSAPVLCKRPRLLALHSKLCESLCHALVNEGRFRR